VRPSRRSFLKTAAAAAVASAAARQSAAEEPRSPPAEELGRLLDRVLAAPVLELEALKSPVVVESLELLHNRGTFLVRARSRDGVESVTAPNSDRLREAYPTFLRRVAPFFAGKDARDLEALLDELYRRDSNYKLQGLVFWCCVAAAEMALLDLLGLAAGKPIGELFGGVLRRDIAVYRASGNRGNRPEEEVDYLRRLVEETGARALKFRLGGRMSRNADSLPGRTDALIPLARKAFGDGMTLYADANSSYDVPNALRIGRLMEEHGYGFFEEPCPFDHLWETREVARALAIPIAGGEQEFSLRRFRWMVEERGADIVQPDLHYFGGYIRATRVARLAACAGMDCTLHMSGGLGYLNVLHFASYTPNAGPFQEFKGESAIPVECATSSLKCEKGIVRCPAGPGFGVVIDADFVRRAETVTAM
jgi:L-alanine-DL-glutamate epimerase-like enolase superfamily enzyme